MIAIYLSLKGAATVNFLDKLDFLMNRDRLNKHTLAQKSGIPYTTIDAFYKKGYANAKLSTLEKLCACFKVSLDYLVNDSIDNPEHGICEDSCDPKEKELLSIFRVLNAEGKEAVLQNARICHGNPSLQKEGQHKSAM